MLVIAVWGWAIDYAVCVWRRSHIECAVTLCAAFVSATLIWEQAQGKTNSMDFAEAIDSSELEEFGFTDDFIIELWGVITDARSGRLKWI